MNPETARNSTRNATRNILPMLIMVFVGILVTAFSILFGERTISFGERIKKDIVAKPENYNIQYDIITAMEEPTAFMILEKDYFPYVEYNVMGIKTNQTETLVYVIIKISKHKNVLYNKTEND